MDDEYFQLVHTNRLFVVCNLESEDEQILDVVSEKYLANRIEETEVEVISFQNLMRYFFNLFQTPSMTTSNAFIFFFRLISR